MAPGRHLGKRVGDILTGKSKYSQAAPESPDTGKMGLARRGGLKSDPRGKLISPRNFN